MKDSLIETKIDWIKAYLEQLQLAYKLGTLQGVEINALRIEQEADILFNYVYNKNHKKENTL